MFLYWVFRNSHHSVLSVAKKLLEIENQAQQDRGSRSGITYWGRQANKKIKQWGLSYNPIKIHVKLKVEFTWAWEPKGNLNPTRSNQEGRSRPCFLARDQGTSFLPQLKKNLILKIAWLLTMKGKVVVWPFPGRS